MTQPRDAEPQLDHAEEQFIRRLTAHYAPEPLTPARRVALDTALWSRLQRQTRQTWRAPAVATVAVAVLILGLSWSSLFRLPAPHDGPYGRMPTMSSTGPLEYELLYARELTDTAERDDDGVILPDDYLVISRVFLQQ